jgi:hypothetical protein
MSLRTSGVTRRSALVAGGAGLTSLAGCLDAIRDLNPLAGDDWSQYRGDRRSGARTDSGPGIDFDDDWRWEVDPPDDAEFVKTVLSATVGTDGSVFLTGSLQYGSGDDTTREGFVVALDAESGDERWGETLDGAVTAAPKAADGDLYVPTTTPPLTGVSADDGSENWTYDPGDDVPSPNFPPAVGDERIHLPRGTSLRAVARDDGDEEWRFEPERGDREVTGVFGCPVPMDGSVYVSGYRYVVSADGEGRPEDIEFLVWSLDGDDGDRRTRTTTSRASASTPSRAARRCTSRAGSGSGRPTPRTSTSRLSRWSAWTPSHRPHSSLADSSSRNSIADSRTRLVSWPSEAPDRSRSHPSPRAGADHSRTGTPRSSRYSLTSRMV